jgi:hypothetical protein
MKTLIRNTATAEAAEFWRRAEQASQARREQGRRTAPSAATAEKASDAPAPAAGPRPVGR